MHIVRGALVAFVVIALIAAGYFIPPLIWTRADAVASIIERTDFGPENVGLGNSRVPCRGPNKALYIFGYTVGATHKDFKTNASGSVCWDIFKSRWVWRIDPPYEHMSSEP